MKRTLQAPVGWVVLAALLAAPAAAQSLGEYARQQQAKKAPTPAAVKEYTNDNLPTSGALSTVSQSSATTSSTSASTGGSKADAAPEKDRSKQEAEWRSKFTEQKNVISKL